MTRSPPTTFSCDKLILSIDHTNHQGLNNSVLTYRFRGHSMSDPGNYRSSEELNREKEERDPILTLRRDLISLGISDDEALTAIDKSCRKRAKDALKEAEKADFPDPETLMDHIYV